MKYIEMTKLKVGDIFTEEVKLKGRKCFIVEMIENGYLICTDRDDWKNPKDKIKKQIKGSVAFLRNANDPVAKVSLDIDAELARVNGFGRETP